jgi:hypothetical protein
MTAGVECTCPECGAEFSAKPEGGHRLLCGDSTVATDVERVLGGVEPHLMVTDPPYGVEYDPAWRNRVNRSNGRRVGGMATGLVLNDDRAEWGEAWALFRGDVAYVWCASPTVTSIFGLRANICASHEPLGAPRRLAC